MPPAKRAPRKSASTADPTPEVSTAARAAKKATTRSTSAGSGTSAGRSTPRQAPARATAARKSTTTGAGAAPASGPDRASTSGAAAQALSATASRVGKAVGSAAGGAAGRAQQAAATAEQAVAAVTRSSRARKAPAKRTAAAGSAGTPTRAEASAGATEVATVVAAATGNGTAATRIPPTSATPTSATPTSAVTSTGPATRPEPPVGAFRSSGTPSDVRAAGRAVRKHRRRQDLGDWKAPAGRPDPIDLLAETNADRIASLVPLRWTRMLESPYAYLRGAAVVMSFDLADTPTSGLSGLICGDAHLGNVGRFVSSEHRQVLDLNDFDESLVGPWEFDVRRLATSIVVAGRGAGLKDKACRSAVSGAVRAYRDTVHALAEMPVLDSWVAPLADELARRKGVADLRPLLQQALGKDPTDPGLRAAKRLATRQRDGSWRFRNDPPELTRLPESESGAVLAGLEVYADSLSAAHRTLLRRFRPVDVALRAAGVGSVGLRSYAVLLEGNGADDPLVLQVKEARPPTIARWLGTSEPDRPSGERIAAATRLMQSASDPLLGWSRIEGREYVVRQLGRGTGDLDPTRVKRNQVDGLGRLVAALLARAHCRSLDPRMLSGYLGAGPQVDDAMVQFALSYADRTAADHAALVQAAKQGRIPTI